MIDSQELRRVRRLLEEMAEMAEHATMTGSLEGGSHRAARRYNAVLLRLEETGTIPPGFFQPLDEESGFADLGVECKLLLGYLRGASEAKPGRECDSGEEVDLKTIVGLAPFLDQKELQELVRAHLPGQGGLDSRLIIGLAPFLGKHELGRIIRENLPEWFRSQETPEAESRPEPAPRPAPAPPPAPGNSLAPVGSTAGDLTAGLRDIAAQLQRADLTPERRAELSERLNRLAQQQARVAWEQAAESREELDMPEEPDLPDLPPLAP